MDDEGIAGNSYAAYIGTPSELFMHLVKLVQKMNSAELFLV